MNEIRLSYILYCIYFIFTLTQKALADTHLRFSSIYSSTYSNKIDSKDAISQIVNIKVAAQKGFIFASAEGNGLIVLDSTNNNEVIFYDKLRYSLGDAFAVTSDGEHIFININEQFYAFQLYKQGNVYKLKEYYTIKTDSSQIKRIHMMANEDRLLIAHLSGVITLVDISQRNKQIINILASYQVDSTLRGLKVTTDMKWVILADYTHGMMVFYWKDDDNTKTTLNLIQVGVSDSVSPSNFVVTNDGRYVLMIEFWDGFTVIDLQVIQQKYINNNFSNFSVDNLTLIVSHWWANSKSFPNGVAIAMTNDENFVMLGERSVGIYIVNIEEKNNPRLFQTISAPYDSLSLMLSKDEKQQYLYYANGSSLLAFQKSEPNLNIDIPNIFNQQRSTNNNAGASKWRWLSVIECNNEFLFQSDYDQGLVIMDLRKSAQLMTQVGKIPIAQEGSSVDNLILFGLNDSYLAVPIQTADSYMNIYNIVDRTNPTLIQSLKTKNPTYVYSMDMSSDHSLFVFDNDLSLQLYDSSQIGSFTQISQWAFTDGVFNGIINGLIISDDSNYVLMTERNNIIALVDISNRKSPILVNKMQTRGGETVIKGKYSTYKKYAFVVGGLYGISVFDMSKFPELVIVCKIQTNGYANHLSLLQNNNFALVSQLDIGQVSLIDFTNIIEPKIVSSFQYLTEHAVSTSVTPSEEYFFIVNQQGVRTVPLKSQIYIHTEVQNILNANTGNPTLISLSKQQPLRVGQQINFQFQILLPIPGIKITNIFYIEYLQVSSLPFWMTYNPIQQVLSLSIVKESLGQNYKIDQQGQSIQNTILVQSNIPVLASNFVFTKDQHNIDQDITQATLIWNYFHEIGLLDKSDFVTSVFQYEKPLTLNLQSVTSTPELLLQLKLVLQNSIMLNPIYFSTQSSLTINVKPTKSTTSASEELVYIDALQSRVYLYMTIDKNYGKFVDKSYNGLITSTTEARDELKLEGDPLQMNYCLNRKLEVFIFDVKKNNSTIPLKDILDLISIKIKFQDNSNYNIEQEYKLSEMSFFRFRDKIINNLNLDLQSQVNSQYSDGKVEIKSSVSIELQQKSFFIADNQTDQSIPFTYSAFLIENDQHVEIPPTFWIQFSPALLKFSGQASFQEFNNQYCFFVNATDSYSVASDTFCIVTNQIPFIIIINLVCQILGPILFLLGFYKYKHIFYNAFYAEKNLYSIELAKMNHTFYHRTLFMGQNVLIAEAILSKFISEFNAGRIGTPHNQDTEDNKGQNENIEISSLPNQVFGQIKAKVTQDLNLSKDRQKKIIEISKIAQQKQTKIEKMYLNSKDKSLLFEKFLEDLISNDITYRFNGELNTISQIKDNLQIPSNLLRLALRTLLAKHLLEKDRVSYRAYTFMKSYALEESEYTINDWYKHFVYINHLEEEEEGAAAFEDVQLSTIPLSRNVSANNQLNVENNQNTQLFLKKQQNIPQVGIKKEPFEKFLSTLSIPQEHLDLGNNQVNQINKSSKLPNSFKFQLQRSVTLRGKVNLNVNKNLLKEAIIGDCLGITYPPPSKMHPCSGESIHLQEHEIASVRAFTKMNDKSSFNGLRRFFKMEYVPLASYENRKLPSWLDYTSKQDVFLLKGCPTIDDQEEILLRFYNQNQYIVKQFLIKVVPYKSDEKYNLKPLQSPKIQIENLQESITGMTTPRKSFQSSNNNIFQKYQKSNFLQKASQQICNGEQKPQQEQQINLDDSNGSTHINNEDLNENPQRLSENQIKSDYQLTSKTNNPYSPKCVENQNFLTKYNFDIENIKFKKQSNE